MSETFSRHTDPTPVECETCGWRGQAKDAVHTYRDDGIGDVEAVDECPECGSEQLIPISEEGVLV